jgi:hypothetical protein
MATYFKDETGGIYELIGEWEGYVWLKDLSSGNPVPVTRVQANLTETKAPPPKIGDIVKDATTGAEAVVLGFTADGGVLTAPTLPDGPPRDGKLDVKRQTPGEIQPGAAAVRESHDSEESK